MSERTRTDSFIGTPVLTLATRLTAPKTLLLSLLSALSYLLKSFLSVANRQAELSHSTTPEEEPFLAFAPLMLLTCVLGVEKDNGNEGEESRGKVFRCYTTTACDKAQTQTYVLLAPLRTCCYMTKDVGNQVPSVSEAV